MHLDPSRLREAVGNEADLDQLANGAGLEPRVLREAWRAERRLDRAALKRLAMACQLPVEALICRCHRKDSSPPCPACDATNEIDDRLLGSAAEHVTAFLIAARQSVPTLRRSELSLSPQTWTASPELFAGGPEFVAATASLQRLGGDLTADDLARTGVAALLGSGEQFDPHVVGADLARYAARGDVERLDLVGLNACDLPDGPVPIAGWELVWLGRSGVDDLMPVPAAAKFMPRPGWNLTAAAATWWLRRSTGLKVRLGGLPFSLLLNSLTRAVLSEYAVEPLTVLALVDDAPLQPLSYYVIERGVAVHLIKGRDLHYYWVQYGPSEQDMWPEFEDHKYYDHFGGSRPQEEWPKWLRFCEVVGPMVERVHQKASAGHQGGRQWERATDEFLRAVVNAREDVPLRYHETALALSIVLETLLETSRQGSVTQKFVDRAGWLGRDAADREDIRERAKALYKAGSDHRHGGELGPLYDSRVGGTASPGHDALDVADWRHLTRQLLLHRLALLDSDTSKSVADLCTEAESQGETGTWMTNVIDEFHSRLQP